MYDLTISGSCSSPGACKQQFDGGGNDVVSQDSWYLDWGIIGETSITITAPEQSSGYTFRSFTYEHQAEPICTELRLYCYTLMLNYAKD